MCTSVASKIAPQSSCSGIETASSSGEMAGYFSRAIFCSIDHTGFLPLSFLDLTSTSRWKWNWRHCSHHSATVSMRSL